MDIIRYVPSFFLLFIFIFINSVISELSSTQKPTMIKLSELLHNQTTSISWNSKTDPCSWAGVTCSRNTNAFVTRLTLSNLGLNNSNFLSIVCQIRSLESLNVSKNFLESIPEGFLTSCGEIVGLKTLNFSGNRISGLLPGFNGFSSLENLDLSSNILSGDVGDKLDGLRSLQKLNIGKNEFSGLVPTKLGKSKALEELDLSGNKFHGSIPEQLAGYRNLTSVDLSENQLTGNLPSSIGELTKLEVLVLSSNDLTGSVPSVLSNMTSLWRFGAYQNNFSGGIPSGISKFLKNLDLSYNNLSGSIPDDLFSQPNLQSVNLAMNKLEGLIPEKISSSLVRMSLGGNNLNGSIPSSIGELRSLVYLQLEDNKLSGLIPPGISSCQKLQLLSLAHNHFTGSLPAELSNLAELQVLNLQFNHLVGEIPSEISKLLNLSTLNISWNSLTGSIPSSISGLQKLVYLDLQENKLNGSVPSHISELKYLVDLQLANNYLSGNIPILPPNLQYSLNLSNNLFQGSIPKSIASLSQVQVLDLSGNRFSGEIPGFLTDIDSLTLLVLSRNNLSGEIPQFSSKVNVTSKPGNDGLIFISPTSTTHKKKMVAAAVIAAIVVAAAISGGLIAFFAIVVSRRTFKVDNVESQSRDDDASSPHVVEGCVLSTNSTHRSDIDFNKAMEAMNDPFNFMLKTMFSTYYKAVMPSGTSYFVKKLNRSYRIFQLGSHENFDRELRALGKLKNSNIMTPLAYMSTADSAYLFYEYAHKGTLFDLLHSNPDYAMDWASRYCIAIGLAQGLTFLHGCSSGPIILLNLSSKSVMLKSIKEPQIADIELCKVIDHSRSISSLSAVFGSVGYIPPEYAYTMRITTAGNVYSFGVIMLELLTGKPAINEGTELTKWVLSRNSEHQQKLDRILDLSISRTSPADRSQMLAVLEIALSCISVSSEARPKMKTVLRMLLNAR